MITRKSRYPSAAVVWPYTPEPSPPLAPVTVDREIDEDLTMSGEHFAKSRPISVAYPREGILSPGGRPTLEDVLNNRAPKPYTLSAYTAFLSQQHCLETLEFTMESKRYREKYDAAALSMAGMPLNYESDEGFELQQDWTRLLDIYVKPGAPQEINLPAEERDDLVDYPFAVKPPPPEALDPALKRMYDLMSDSIFIPFCNSLKAAPHAQTYNALSEYANRDDRLDPSRMTYDERGAIQPRKPSRRRQSPSPASPSNFDLPSRRSNPPRKATQTSSLSSALNRPKSAQLSTLASNTSAVSAAESAVTDDSGSGESPGLSDHGPTTPPTTPPGSELGGSASYRDSLQSPKQHRSDSGGWKKMGMKIWGNKRKGPGSLREHSDE